MTSKPCTGGVTSVFFYLPPANEVWGKAMFLQVSVCPQGGSLYDVTFCLAPWSHVPSEVSVQGSLGPGGSVSEGVSFVFRCSNSVNFHQQFHSYRVLNYAESMSQVQCTCT